MGSEVCSKCGECKFASEFPKSGKKCKDCVKKCNKAYYKSNADTIKANNKKYRKSNIELHLLKEAKKRSKDSDFNISLEDVKNVMTSICPLLEIKMMVNENHIKDNSFTLDKIIPQKGYVRDNILIISSKANRSKSDATIEEYEKIVNNFKKNIIGDCKVDKIIKNLFNNAKKRAKNNKLKFNINKEYLMSIYPIDNKCPLLEVPFVKNTTKAASLDRIDPNNGYIKGNVQIISHRANTIKNNLTFEEMYLLLYNWKNIINE